MQEKDLEKKIEILTETDDYLVLNKPAFVPVHPGAGEEKYTIVDFLAKNYPDLIEVGEKWKLSNDKETPRYGIAHRLDEQTSGVLLVAKKENVFKFFKKQFKKRLIKKHYKTFVYGVLKEDVLLIDKELGRSKKDFRKYSCKNTRGKKREAQTLVHLIKTKGKGNQGISYLDVYPKTGRTHQIRAHLSCIGKPIVCDKLYAPKKECVLGFSRLALHSFCLTFLDLDKNEVKVCAPLPDDFKKAEELLKSLKG